MIEAALEDCKENSCKEIIKDWMKNSYNYIIFGMIFGLYEVRSEISPKKLFSNKQLIFPFLVLCGITGSLNKLLIKKKDK